MKEMDGVENKHRALFKYLDIFLDNSDIFRFLRVQRKPQRALFVRHM